MDEADEVLPLASSQGGKLFHVIRSSFVDSLEASLKSYHTRLTQVHSSQGFTSHTVVFPVLTLHQSTLNLAYLYRMLTSYFLSLRANSLNVCKNILPWMVCKFGVTVHPNGVVGWWHSHFSLHFFFLMHLKRKCLRCQCSFLIWE